MVSNCVLLLFAGHETTTNLLANGLWLLLEHPDQMEKLRANPGLGPSAVEEFLRFEAPVPATNKVALEDVSWRGTTIRAGDKVLPFIAAANRDPEKFPEPDRLNLHRKNSGAHMAFSQGEHHCVGAPLARLELQIAFEILLENFERFELLHQILLVLRDGREREQPRRCEDADPPGYASARGGGGGGGGGDRTSERAPRESHSRAC